MSPEIRESISSTFGFEPELINSALVSAQNRQRLYWVGMRVGDEYKQIRVPRPEDKHILLKDILGGGGTLTEKNQMQLSALAEGQKQDAILKRRQDRLYSINTTKGKSQTIKAQYQNTSVRNICIYHSTYGATGVAEKI